MKDRINFEIKYPYAEISCLLEHEYRETEDGKNIYCQKCGDVKEIN